MNSIAFIKAFFEDFLGPIATKAADYAKIFENKGFDSKESLKGILTADQVEKWRIPEGHAIQIVQQTLLLFAPVVLPVFTPVGGGAPPQPLALTHVWSQKFVKPLKVADPQSSISSMYQLRRLILSFAITSDNETLTGPVRDLEVQAKYKHWGLLTYRPSK